MAKVNGDRAWDYFKGRAEQRFVFWIKQAESNIEFVKKDLASLHFWQFKKRTLLKQKLLAAFLEIQIIKGAINEIRLLK